MASPAKYYRKNPKARARRLAQQKRYMKGKGREIRLEADRLSADLPSLLILSTSNIKFS